MASAIAFDTHAYVKKLKDAGVSEKAAEVQAEALVSLIEDRLATKQELFGVEASLKREIKELETNLRRDMKELEMRMTIRLGAMMIVAVSVVATLVKIL